MDLSRMCGFLCGIALLSACGNASGEAYTLYRNSPFESGARVHWATFDATESNSAYNLNNCLMAAKVLNANVAANAKAEGKERDASVGFWCEGGHYREKGSIPASFPAAFPTDA